LKNYFIQEKYSWQFTLRKSRNHITSGLGSPITSQRMITVSPSIASVDKGFVIKRGSFEYLKVEQFYLQLCVGQLVCMPRQTTIIKLTIYLDLCL